MGADVKYDGKIRHYRLNFEHLFVDPTSNTLVENLRELLGGSDHPHFGKRSSATLGNPLLSDRCALRR
jgi:hypothetical protein